MEGRRYEFVIVGSGAGGATLARELSRKGKDVLVVERGRRAAKMGATRDMFHLYDLTKLGTPTRSKEGVTLVRAITAGGTTVVSCGCAVRCLEDKLSDLGIALDEEFAEVERELNVAPIAEGLLSEGSERLRWAAQELGYTMALMPKFIDPVRCQKCGQCILGCAHGAKWTALDYLDEASETEPMCSSTPASNTS